MITIRTSLFDISTPYNRFYKEYYKCPVCKTFYPITSMSFFCGGCFSQIVDMFEVTKDKNYLLLYHFGTIPESGQSVGGLL